MTSRRALDDTLSEIMGGMLDALAAAPAIGVREVDLALPIELVLERSGGRTRLLADLPRRRTRTAFDREPGRLRVLWRAELTA